MFLAYLRRRFFFITLFFIYLLALTLNAVGIDVWLPGCPIYSLSGIECLGCGINRALISLIQLDLNQAWQYNPLVFVYVPIGAIFFSRDIYRHLLNPNQTKQNNNYGTL